jgi:hypothetical protein
MPPCFSGVMILSCARSLAVFTFLSYGRCGFATLRRVNARDGFASTPVRLRRLSWVAAAAA